MGAIERNVGFQILDNLASFNMRLGRLWLHKHQAVPSTFHQKVKMLINGEVVTVVRDNLFAIITNNNTVLEAEHSRKDELYNFETIALCKYPPPRVCDPP